jgi:4-hydroxy 2-oxovalerate aldolase
VLKLLDCTLRDGGYYTNWDFDKNLVENYLTCVEKLPIEYIEVGYRSTDKAEYFGEYFYLSAFTIKEIVMFTSKKIVLMLDAKDCFDLNLDVFLSNIKDDISLIRIATAPEKILESLGLVQKLVSLGFEVALNVMYISKIKDDDVFFTYIEGIENKIKCLYLVDSYGSIYPDQLELLISKVKRKTNVTLGFHGHNNIELAFVNTLKAIESGVTFIDSTILGMGRGAGNLKTELILTHLKSNAGYDVDLNTLGMLTEIFMPLQEEYKWGTNLAYMVSGSYSLPQKNVMEALEIDRYSLAGIVSSMGNEAKRNFPKFDPQETVSNCLVIGGGKSVALHINAISEYLNLHKDILVIHSTSKYLELFSHIEHTQFFAVAGDELLKINHSISTIDTYILEPMPRSINLTNQFKDEFCELKEITFINEYFDSPLTLSFQIAIDMNIRSVKLVGFDGYSKLKNKKELYLMQENQNIIDSYMLKRDAVSLTPTKYKNITHNSVYGKID